MVLGGDNKSAPVKARERAVAEQYVPSLVLAGGLQTADSPVKLLNDLLLLSGKPTAYVCRAYTCDKPVTKPKELSAQLESAAKVTSTTTAVT